VCLTVPVPVCRHLTRKYWAIKRASQYLKCLVGQGRSLSLDARACPNELLPSALL
jgi:hypothetical protein